MLLVALSYKGHNQRRMKMAEVEVKGAAHNHLRERQSYEETAAPRLLCQ